MVSVIVVNFRTERYLRECLASVRAQSYESIELILIDNASPGFQAGDYDDLAPDRLIHNRRNRGFAAASNQGVGEARGEFILLLNADAKIPPDFAAAGVAEFARDEDIGSVVPQILCWDDETTVESTGHLLRRDFTAAHRDHLVPVEQATADSGQVFGGTAACVLYRRAMLEQIRFRSQYFDESFFAYFEDVDLDLRASLAGWRAWYQPKLVALHIGGGSGERRRWQLRLIAEKNRYLSLMKNLTFADILPNLHYILAYELYHLVRNLAAPYVFLALGSFFRYLPSALSWRKHIQRSRRLPPAALRQLLVARFGGKARVPAKAPSPVELGKHPQAHPPPAVSVIVLNYNGYADTARCLQALRGQTFENFEVILVDNGSAAAEGERIQRDFREARVILALKNLGFAGGVNLGVTKARGKYLVLLNNDAEPEPGFLDELVNGLEKSGADAGCGALVSADEEPTNDALNLLGYNIKGAMGGHVASFYPSGGAAILRTSSLQKLGAEVFDSDYFIYHEDVSLGFRIRLGGGSIIKIRSARARHRGGATVSRVPRSPVRYFQQRNRVLNLLSFYGGMTLWKLVPFLILDWVGSHLRSLLSFSEFVAVLRTDLFFLTHPRYLINRRFLYGRLRHECPLAAAKRPSVKDSELTRFFSARMLPHSGLLNRLARWYFRLVHLSFCEGWERDSL